MLTFSHYVSMYTCAYAHTRAHTLLDLHLSSFPFLCLSPQSTQSTASPNKGIRTGVL